MTDNELTFSNYANQEETPGIDHSALDLGQLLGALLRFRDSTTNSLSFAKAFLEYLARLPIVSQVGFYIIDQKTRDIGLELLYAAPAEEKDPAGLSIPARSTETLARVAFNAQAFYIADLETELVTYQNAVLDSKSRSLFISPILKSNQVTSLLDIQFTRPQGIKREDLPGLAVAVQLFGEFLEEKTTQDDAGVSFPELVTYSRVSRELISSPDPKSLNKILLTSFHGSDYVSFIFKVGNNDLVLEDLFDAKGTGFDASLIGLKVETTSFEETIQKKEIQFFTDLPSNAELGDLFSFFIRRECSSLAILPLILDGEIHKLIIIGSRDLEPINFQMITVYQKILENLQDRLAFESRAQQTTYLEEDLQFLLQTSSSVQLPVDQADFFKSLLQLFNSVYNDQILLSVAEFNEGRDQLHISQFSPGAEPVVFQLPISTDERFEIGSLTEPINAKEVSPSMLPIFSSLNLHSESLFIPFESANKNNGFLLLDNPLGDKKLSTISHVSLKVLSGMVSSFFKFRTLRGALSTLDETVTKTVNRQLILNQISIQAGAGRSQGDILNSIPNQFVDFHLCDQACILTPATGGEYEIRYSRALSDELRGQILQPGDGLAGKAATTNKAVMSSPSQENRVGEFFDSASQSGLAAPISFGDEIFAILEMEHSKADQYNEYDLELIQIFCLNIGSLLANLKLVDQVKAQVDRQEKLYEITNKLRRSLDMGAILQISASEIGRIANARKASIQITIAEQPEPDLNPETSGGEE